MRSAFTKLARLCFCIHSWDADTPILGESHYLTPEELLGDLAQKKAG